MAKKPKDAPEVGDRVEWRGRGARGTLVQVDADDWSHVRWDDRGPLLVHLFELSKIAPVPLEPPPVRNRWPT